LVVDRSGGERSTTKSESRVTRKGWGGGVRRNATDLRLNEAKKVCRRTRGGGIYLPGNETLNEGVNSLAKRKKKKPKKKTPRPGATTRFTRENGKSEGGKKNPVRNAQTVAKEKSVDCPEKSTKGKKKGGKCNGQRKFQW